MVDNSPPYQLALAQETCDKKEHCAINPKELFSTDQCPDPGQLHTAWAWDCKLSKDYYLQANQSPSSLPGLYTLAMVGKANQLLSTLVSWVGLLTNRF